MNKEQLSVYESIVKDLKRECDKWKFISFLLSLVALGLATTILLLTFNLSELL